MAYNTTEIATTPQPATPQAPQLQAYQQPNVTAVKPTIDTSNTGYQAPTSQPFNTRNLDQGLLEFNPTSSGQLTFNSQGLNTDNMKVETAQVPQYQAGQDFISHGALVENRIKGLLDPNNDMNRAVQANVKAAMNARGIAGSSIDDTSAQSAMIQNALHIATPDAQTMATADLNRQGATYGSQRANQDVTNQGSLSEQTGKINAGLDDLRASQAWDSTQQKAAIQADLNKQQANIAGTQANQQAQLAADGRDHQGLLEGAAKQQQANISAELAGMESVSSQNLAILQNKLETANQTTKEQNAAIMQAFSAQQELIRTSLNNEFQKASQQAQLNAAQRDSLSQAMTTMANNYEITIQNIMLDMNLNADAKNAAIARINKIFNQDMNNIANIFGATYTNTTT